TNATVLVSVQVWPSSVLVASWTGVLGLTQNVASEFRIVEKNSVEVRLAVSIQLLATDWTPSTTWHFMSIGEHIRYHSTSRSRRGRDVGRRGRRRAHRVVGAGGASRPGAR